jgi:two-component system, cell cycle sensor histidine kinase and response regulator CckA
VEASVLVLDDEEFIRNIAITFLNNIGCSATCAAKGHQALEMYQKAISDGALFDLVILDLPISGFIGEMKVLEHLRTITPGVKAVASKGFSDDPIMANPATYGFIGKLSKPCLQEEFV